MKRFSLLFAAVIGLMAFEAGTSAFPKNDPHVRSGVLPNGLTYYIRNNDYPEGYADFYLVVKAGIADQHDVNSGVAHFLEHMCFNGTEHFPGASMTEWLRGKGVANGENFNAVTTGESTVYMIGNVPVKEQSVVDSCILALRDLSHAVTIDEEAVEREKAVILEEMRYRDNAKMRVEEALRRYVYGDNKYGRYIASGTEESIRNMSVEDVRTFYEEMYRPDLQAVIIVGSIDENAVEKSLREVFADVSAVDSPLPEKEPLDVSYEDPVVGLVYDADLATSGLKVIWRYGTGTYDDPMSDYRESMMKLMVSRLVGARMDMMNASKNMAVEMKMSKTLYDSRLSAMELTASVIPGREIAVFRDVMEEIEKVRRFGFTESELKRLAEQMSRSYADMTSAYNESNNAGIVTKLYENYMYGTPYPDVKVESNLALQILKSIDAETLGRYAKTLFTDIEPLVVCSMPARTANALSESDFIRVLTDIRNLEIDGPEDAVFQSLPDLSGLEGGKTEFKRKYSDGTFEWYLENGMKVVFVPASKDSDIIGVDLFWKGGMSLVPTSELAVFEDDILGMYFKNAGVANMNQASLNNVLSQKTLAVNPYIRACTHGITGQAYIRDAEFLFQMLYMYAAMPRFDKREFDDNIQTVREILPTLKNQPSYEIEALCSPVSYGKNPRCLLLDEKLLTKVRLEHLESNYNRMFTNAAGSTALIIGDIKPKVLQKLVEKYLGSIPTIGIESDIVYDNAVRLVSGRISREFTLSTESSAAEVMGMYHAPMDFSPANYVAVKAVQYILSVRIENLLRSKEGASYSSQVYADLVPLPEETALLQLVFHCDPAQASRLRDMVAEEVGRLASEGPGEEEVSQAVSYICKGFDEQAPSMSYRFNMMKEIELFGTTSAFAYRSAEALTPDKVRDALNQLLASGNHIEFISSPASVR